MQKTIENFFKGELEQSKLTLSQRVKELEMNLNEQGASFRAQVMFNSFTLMALLYCLEFEHE